MSMIDDFIDISLTRVDAVGAQVRVPGGARRAPDRQEGPMGRAAAHAAAQDAGVRATLNPGWVVQPSGSSNHPSSTACE
jgi:hypothetical protein